MIEQDCPTGNREAEGRKAFTLLLLGLLPRYDNLYGRSGISAQAIDAATGWLNWLVEP